MKAGFTMKALSMAVLMGFGASAMAACPTTFEQPTGPWTAKNAVLGTAVVAGPAASGSIPVGGAATTLCRLDTSITGNAGSAAAFARDDTPAGEPRYRARFYMNLDNLTGLNTTQIVRVFAATTDAPSGGIPEVVKLTVFGNGAGTNKVLGVIPAGMTASTVSLGATTGWRRVEIDWVKGAAGSLKVWIDGAVEASPTASLTGDNSAWGGVDSAALGLFQASANYRTAQLNKVVGFDEFDSRRSTFIGN